VGTPADVEAYVGTVPQGIWFRVAWLLDAFVAFGVLASWGYRRDRQREA